MSDDFDKEFKQGKRIMIIWMTFVILVILFGCWLAYKLVMHWIS